MGANENEAGSVHFPWWPRRTSLGKARALFASSVLRCFKWLLLFTAALLSGGRQSGWPSHTYCKGQLSCNQPRHRCQLFSVAQSPGDCGATETVLYHLRSLQVKGLTRNSLNKKSGLRAGEMAQPWKVRLTTKNIRNLGREDHSSSPRTHLKNKTKQKRSGVMLCNCNLST